MPFPTGEQVRAAVEKVVQNTLASESGDWEAYLPNGNYVEFRPREDGTIEATKCLPDEELADLPDDQPAEKTYKLRVRVELVEG